MRHVSESVHGEQRVDGSQAVPHGGEAVRLQDLQEGLHREQQAQVGWIDRQIEILTDGYED